MHPEPARKRPRTTVVGRMLRRASTLPAPSAPPPDAPPAARLVRNDSLPARSPRNIRTYAGASRSFLVALPVPDASPADDDAAPHESYADLRARWGIDLAEDDAPRPGSEIALPAPNLKSITELRSKGESRRFVDEVGYLFEGLDSASAIGLRRASALEVVGKLSDPDFNRRAKASDFYVRAWDKFWAARAGTSDKVLDTTIAFFAALAARDPRNLTEVAQHSKFIPTLLDILAFFDHKKDVLASVLAKTSDDGLKSLGILRTEITALKSLAKIVSKESDLSSEKPSARFFVSLSLAALPPSLLSDHHLPALLASLRAELGLLQDRIAAYESGLPIIPPSSMGPGHVPSLSHVEACLRLLDSHLLGHWSSADDRPPNALLHVDGLAPELISLCIVCSSLLEEDNDVARKCLCGTMRVLTLLSHDDSWWCDAALDVPNALEFVATIAMRSQTQWSNIQDVETSSVQAFDLLCLALGLIMNWATSSPRVAALARTQSIDPACGGTRQCVRMCACSDQTSILECLSTLHVQYAESPRHDEDDPPERAFLRGYTAILLGLLIKDEPANRTIVTSALPGAPRSKGIKSLVVHCRAFLDLYDDATPQPSSRDSTPDSATHQVRSRHRATWDKRGEEIARDVIASLEKLCDAT